MYSAYKLNKQGIGDGQRGMVCCNSWGCKESDMTKQMNWTELNLYAEYIMRHTGLEEAQAGIKISGRNINNPRYADDTTFMADSEKDYVKEYEKEYVI